MYFIVFGLIAVILFIWLYTSLYPQIQPVSLPVWLFSISIITFFYYWLDKRLSRVKWLHIRIPEAILNLLAIVGGFPGAWLGRFICEHKTNIKEHLGMLIILILTTVVYCLLAFAFFPPQ